MNKAFSRYWKDRDGRLIRQPKVNRLDCYAGAGRAHLRKVILLNPRLLTLIGKAR